VFHHPQTFFVCHPAAKKQLLIGLRGAQSSGEDGRSYLALLLSMTTKNKAYIAIVSVGLLALVIDRVYFTPPAAVAAPAAIAEAVPRSPARTEGGVSEPAADGTISSKLAAVGLPDLQNLTDSFSPSNAWIGGGAQPVVDDFKTTHKLTAVMTSHSGGGAIVNGQLIKLGQTLDGFTLTTINSRTVEFVKGGTKIELSLGI
jgi:hypothetical protein